MQTAIILMSVAIVIASLIIANAIIKSAKYKAGIHVEKKQFKFFSKAKILFKNRNIKLAALGLSIIIIISIPIFWGQDILGYMGVHTIRITDIEVIQNDGVGENWKYSAQVISDNSNRWDISRYGIYILDDDEFPLKLIARAIESDDWNDNGKNSTIITKTKIGTTSIDVVVHEFDGAKFYYNKKAKVRFTFKIR